MTQVHHKLWKQLLNLHAIFLPNWIYLASGRVFGGQFWPNFKLNISALFCHGLMFSATRNNLEQILVWKILEFSRKMTKFSNFRHFLYCTTLLHFLFGHIWKEREKLPPIKLVWDRRQVSTIVFLWFHKPKLSSILGQIMAAYII